SDLAIETALTLRLVFHLPLRHTEGFVRSILTVMRAGLDAPDHDALAEKSGAGCRVAGRPSQRTAASSTARGCPLLMKASGPRRNTAAAAREAGRSCTWVSTAPA
ncbi:MAG: transposase, partial [Acidobacteria bacterium]|nr:transposase [Acidobacteriota bacterium]